MTKIELKALQNYTEHLYEMKQYYTEQADRMETETNKEWYRERAKEYFNGWITAHTILIMLEGKEGLKFWAER